MRQTWTIDSIFVVLVFWLLLNSNFVNGMWVSFRRLSQQSFEHVAGLKSGQLRILSESAYQKGSLEGPLWQSLLARTQSRSEDRKLTYWDAIAVLANTAKAFANSPEEHSVLTPYFETIGETIVENTSKLSPANIIHVFNAYETLNLRPIPLYKKLFFSITQNIKQIYAEELSLLVSCLARQNLVQAEVFRVICDQLVANPVNLRFLHCCSLMGGLSQAARVSLALGEWESSLKAAATVLWQRGFEEVRLLPVQELFDIQESIHTLEFSYAPLEKQAFGLLCKHVKEMWTPAGINQFDRPFAVLHFLIRKDYVYPSFVQALCKWCLQASYRPALRSYKRPLSSDLVHLFEFLQTFQEGAQKSNPYLIKAIRNFVASRGGLHRTIRKRKPLVYHSRRRYIRTADPLAEVSPAVQPYKGPSLVPAPMPTPYKLSPYARPSGPFFVDELGVRRKVRMARWLRFRAPEDKVNRL